MKKKVPSYEKTFERDPVRPPIVIETLSPVPMPGEILERTEESLEIVLSLDKLAPIDTAAVTCDSFVENPKPFPNNKKLPGEKHGALNLDADERMGRSYVAAAVTVPIWWPMVTAAVIKVPNPRETLQKILVEACHFDISQRVVPMTARPQALKVPKKPPLISTSTADEPGTLPGLAKIKTGI